MNVWSPVSESHSESPLNIRWYVVHTRSRHERVAQGDLLKAGFRVFLPEHTVLSRRRNRRKRISVPLFPGYLFVAPGGNEGWTRDVLVMRSVVRILSLDGCPLPVPEQDVESLRTLVNCGEFLESVSCIRSGDRVRVDEGPLAGAEGVVLRKGRRKYLVVSVSLLHRSVSVMLDEEILVKVS